MSDNLQPIPIPQGRDGVTGEWAARLTRRVNELRVMFGKGFRVLSRGPEGTRVECVATAESRLAATTDPWTVRHHVTEDDDEGQWEIWLPTGCMSVGTTLQPLNKPAKEKSGHDDEDNPDKDGWYAFNIDEEEGAATTSTADGVTTTYRDFEIVAHAKTSALLDGVDAIDGPARKYLYVSARKILTAEEKARQTDEAKAKDTWGDELAPVVARVRIGTVRRQGESPEDFRRIEQSVRAPITVQGRETTGFDLVWDFDFDNDGALEVKHVYCVRQVASAAGITLQGPDMTEVTDAQETIYAKILTDPLNPENESTVEVVKDPTGFTSRDNFVTWLRLYTMSYNAVVDNYRPQSLANIQIYR